MKLILVIFVLCTSLAAQVNVGLSLGTNAETMPDCDYYTMGSVWAGLSIGYTTDKVELSIGISVSGDIGVDQNRYFGGWYVYDEYYDEFGDYVYEYVHDDSWLEYSVGFNLPISILLPEHGLAVSFYWNRDNLLYGDSFGLSITREWIWEF